MFVAREPHGFNQKQRQFLQGRFFEVQRLVKEYEIRPQPGAYESFGTSSIAASMLLTEVAFSQGTTISSL